MMDPIAAEIIAGLLWFFLGDIGVGLVFWGLFLVSGLLAGLTDRMWVGVVGVVIAWLAAVGSFIFVWYNIIIHIANLLQLLFN